MLKRLAFGLLVLLAYASALAVPLDTYQNFAAGGVQDLKVAPASILLARGSGTRDFYVLEVDPTTGQLPVDAQFTFNALLLEDHDYGTPGPDTLRTAAILGVGSTAVSDSNPVPISDAGGSITVDGTVAATQSGSWNINDISGTISLPTGAATETTLQNVESSTGASALSLASIEDDLTTIVARTPALGQATMANSSPVTIASDQTQPRGRSYGDSVRNAYASTNVTTAAWVQIIASTAADINQLYIFDSCGQTLELGTGAAAAESRKLLIPPGGPSDPINLRIPAGTRVALKAISGNCTTGEFVMTGLN